jgi:hypothetical protein
MTNYASKNPMWMYPRPLGLAAPGPTPRGTGAWVDRQKVAKILRAEIKVIELKLDDADRLSAQLYRGESLGLRRGVALLLIPDRPPFKRIAPWVISEQLNDEAEVLEQRIKLVGRLAGQQLYGRCRGLRRAAELIAAVPR